MRHCGVEGVGSCYESQAAEFGIDAAGNVLSSSLIHSILGRLHLSSKDPVATTEVVHPQGRGARGT